MKCEGGGREEGEERERKKRKAKKAARPFLIFTPAQNLNTSERYIF